MVQVGDIEPTDERLQSGDVEPIIEGLHTGVWSQQFKNFLSKPGRQNFTKFLNSEFKNLVNLSPNCLLDFEGKIKKTHLEMCLFYVENIIY